MNAPFFGSLAPSPQCGRFPQFQRLIEKPSTAIAITSHAAMTFRNVIAPPSFPKVPTRLVASAIWTTWGHQSGPEQAPKMQSTICSILAFEDVNDCSNFRGNNGQLFNRCDSYNCDFFHQNVLLQLCRHRHVGQVLTGDRELPDNVLSFPGANRLVRAGWQAFSDSRWLSYIWDVQLPKLEHW